MKFKIFFSLSGEKWYLTILYCISLVHSVFLSHVYFFFCDLSVLCHLPAGFCEFCLWTYRSSLYILGLTPFLAYIYYRYFLLLVTCFVKFVCDVFSDTESFNFVVKINFFLCILIFHEATLSSLLFFFKILLMVIACFQRNLKWSCHVGWNMMFEFDWSHPEVIDYIREKWRYSMKVAPQFLHVLFPSLQLNFIIFFI